MNTNNYKDSLENRICTPCRGGINPLTHEEIRPYLSQLSPEWKIVNNHHLERTFSFKNFHQALDFTNQVGQTAEEQGHHPDIHLSWGKVILELWTHKINGLHPNDFILAKKIEFISH